MNSYYELGFDLLGVVKQYTKRLTALSSQNLLLNLEGSVIVNKQRLFQGENGREPDYIDCSCTFNCFTKVNIYLYRYIGIYTHSPIYTLYVLYNATYKLYIYIYTMYNIQAICI